MKKSFYKKSNSSGPGGRGCGCCFPQSGKFRHMAKRLDEKRSRAFFSRLLEKHDD